MTTGPGSAPRMSSGLVHLTKVHQSQRSLSQGSFASINSVLAESDNETSATDRRWSWKHLQREFNSRGIEKLFTKYQIRLQLRFFIVLLMLNMFFNLVAIIVFFFDEDPNAFPGPVILRATGLIVHLSFFILTCMEEEWLRPQISRVAASCTVLVAMILSEHGAALYGFIGTDEPLMLQRIRPTFYMIITNHVFLPFPSRIYGCVATFIIIAIEITLTINTRLFSSCPAGTVYKHVAADIIFYLSSALIGFILTYLLEIANRRAFLGHRKCIYSKFRLQNHREQQDQLLASCLPTHLTERVRKDIRQVLLHQTDYISSRPFNELYMEKYKGVSILYADIVNSMLLTNKLSSYELVETLNDLFGRFDDLAAKHNCLRIRLLGDCYYCVSAIPDPDPLHALNCVRMGLAMIKVIRSVREDRQINVDMRIGIHSGMVLSGMLGLHKYDIWSKDSMTASAMEHHGVPGKVHISKATLELIPLEERKHFTIMQRNHPHEESTYLVTEGPHQCHSRSYSGSPRPKRPGQTERLRHSMGKFRRSSSFDSFYLTKRTVLNRRSVRKYRELLINEVMEVDIDSLPLSKKSQWLHRRGGINPFFMNFATEQPTDAGHGVPLSGWEHERRFQMQPDPLFRYYLLCSTFIFAAIVTIKMIIPKTISSKLQWSLGATLFVILASLICSYSRPEKLKYGFRIFVWLLVSVLLILCSTIDIVADSCQTDGQTKLSSCSFTWYYTFCMILSITNTTLFIRINLWYKFAIHLMSILLYVALTKSPCSVLSVLDREVKWNLLGYAPHVGHVYYICIVALMLHVIDRQIEYILRLDYRWTTKLEDEKQEVEMVGEINRILLSNILPVHVAERYLTRAEDVDALYHESYSSVAVMFASIPNYIDFYTETSINEEGLKCLLLLNEIICDFDKVLDDRFGSFGRIEKIKTIGSTYMACCGLQPGRTSTDSNISSEQMANNVVDMVKFATALMESIQRINQDALQDFKLRIGISVGPVVAGIVGASKPQYDVWGDTVNVASRMESNGVAGRIHVTKEVATILQETDIRTQCRGPIMIKGKGELVTYLVNTPFDSDENQMTKV